jgi:hypothetical protein
MQLENLEIVQYETKTDGNYYLIKYPEEIRKILNAFNEEGSNRKQSYAC